MQFPKFVSPTCSVRELLRFLPKLTNFPENQDTSCRGNKRFKSFPLIYASGQAGGWWARFSRINHLNRACKRSSPVPYGISWSRQERVFGNTASFPWRYLI